MSPAADAVLTAMRDFYELFPYPARWLVTKPPDPAAHLLSHTAFYRLLLKGRKEWCQAIWHQHRGTLTFSQNKSPAASPPPPLPVTAAHEHLRELQTFEREHPQRILLAGCGTDEPLLFTHLHPHSSLVAIDLSTASLLRAEALLHRHLPRRNTPVPWNITFLSGDAAVYLKQEPRPQFDFIQCFGVLHHQPNPRDFLHEMCMSLKERTGLLRLMVYSYKGRRLERGLQRRWGRFSYLKSLVVLAWVVGKRLAHPFSWNRRFRYVGLRPNRIADAFLHPSDPGLPLENVTHWLADEGMDIVFCEAKIHEVGWVSGWGPKDASAVWQQICAADATEDLLTNPVLVAQKREGEGL